VDDEVQVVLFLQGRLLNRVELVDLHLVRLLGVFARVEDVSGVDTVRARREGGHWPIFPRPGCPDVEATIRLEASPHVPFWLIKVAFIF